MLGDHQSLRQTLTPKRKDLFMDYVLGATCAAGLLLYLLYALLKPEKF
ncbi:MAG: K(+)-transporting ATPase subunit F [Bryobacterales bacterium]|nr:K(+)-transporting ATPase subunit F [Bryobacterales bacterium]